MKISKKSILPFFGFFIITISNGRYINQHYGDGLEYCGLLVLLFSCLFPLKRKRLNDYARIIFLSILLSLGPALLNNSSNVVSMIFSTSLMLMCFSTMSDGLITCNQSIKVVANAILLGAVVTAIIGLLTGTLGLRMGSSEAIIGVLFLSGFQVKNYCGGIWLILYILYYTYFFRQNSVKCLKHRAFLILLFLLNLLSGSKGSCFLCLIFWCTVNLKKIILIRNRYKKVFRICGIIIGVLVGIYVYNNILGNVVTYAYRMRGLQKLVSYMSSDVKRLVCGFSDIAYAGNRQNYTINMRNFLGWEASVEMAYVNIIIKNGLLGFIVYFLVFKRYYKASRRIVADNEIVLALIIVTLMSGFVETYIVSIHYVVGPVMYCLLNGLIAQNRYNVCTCPCEEKL